MKFRKPSSSNIFILLVEAQESASMAIERYFHENSRPTDIVTHLLDGTATPLDGDYLLCELQRRKYDCVLMDHRLPRGNNGLSLCKYVRENLQQPIPIILFDENVDSALRALANASGATDILDKKDLTSSALRRVIDIAVDASRSAAPP